MALGAGAGAAVGVAPLLVRAAAQVELATTGRIAEGDGGGVRAGQQVDGGARDVGTEAGCLIGPGDRPGDVLAGFGS